MVIVLVSGCRVYAVERRCINLTDDEWRKQAISRIENGPTGPMAEIAILQQPHESVLYT